MEELRSAVVFEPEYRNPDALRDWRAFLTSGSSGSSPRRCGKTGPLRCAPPRLGGNARMGVFATRSPFRPNPIGLSCVRLERIEQHPQWGPALWVAGADLMDGTPIYDVKPYLPYADCRPEAAGGFASQPKEASLRVECPPELLEPVEEARRAALLGVLAQDPRPTYQHDPDRVYGLAFGGWEVKFTVAEDVLTVREIFHRRQEP